jgi:hypothetical protein
MLPAVVACAVGTTSVLPEAAAQAATNKSTVLKYLDFIANSSLPRWGSTRRIAARQLKRSTDLPDWVLHNTQLLSGPTSTPRLRELFGGSFGGNILNLAAPILNTHLGVY